MHALSQRRYGVVLLDGLLPDTHGIDLAKRIVSDARSEPPGICFVSGSLRLSQAMRCGVTALPKPLRVRALTDAVESLLEWREGAPTAVAERLDAIDALSADLLVR
jgi:DNA-binding NtrC family response regulator